MNIETKKYGKPINQADANRHFRLFMKIKKRVHNRIKELLKDDDDALRYYCGRNGTNPADEDLAYVFDKTAITRILEKLANNEADGVVIFNGVRTKEDSFDEDLKGSTDIDGRPTLMIFPYKYSLIESNAKDSNLNVLSGDGSEHPGTGGGGMTMSSATGEIELPTVFKPEQIHFR